MTHFIVKYVANDGKGRDCQFNSTEGASKLFVNLSGKKTLAGRNSGERSIIREPPKGKAFIRFE